MPTELFVDNAITTLAGAAQPWASAPVAGTQESWQVASTAAPFPTPTASQTQFRAQVNTPTYSDTTPEIVIVNLAIDGTHFQVVRGADGTTPKAHSLGDVLMCVQTATQVPFVPLPGTKLWKAECNYPAAGGVALAVTTTPASVAGLGCPVIVPPSGEVEIIVDIPYLGKDATAGYYTSTILEDGVGIYTKVWTALASISDGISVAYFRKTTPGPHTYSFHISTSAGAASLYCYPAAANIVVGGDLWVMVPWMEVVAK